MSESINEIKINNDDTYLIVKQIIKLLYLVIEDNKRIQSELFLLIDNYPDFVWNFWGCYNEREPRESTL